jgi:ornithine cyclodeaminase/alanine dehydrogenase
MREVIAAVESAFREHGEGRVEMPPKPGIHTRPDSFLHAMPAFVPALGAAGIKWVGGYPANPARGLPYITGLLVLNDEETGIPLAVMDCTWITAARTGAASAVAARYLARTDSNRVGILGCGVQGRSHIEALREIFPLEEVIAYDISAGAAARFASDVSQHAKLRVLPATQPREAVENCDIVVTAGPILRQPHATIKPGWLGAGALALLVDFDSYWDSVALAEIDKFCTDDIAQLEYYRAEGYFQNTPRVYATIGELVADKKPGRTNRQERAAACNLGIALADLAVAAIIYRRALEHGAGSWLAL